MSEVVPMNIAPTRILYAMFRVVDLEKSILFYRNMLGMKVVARETFPDAKFTAVFMGYGESKDETVLELTSNWGELSYEQGTAFGNLSLEVKDVYELVAFLEKNEVEVTRPAGELPIVSNETGKRHTLAYITDPDGYKIELMQN